MAKRKMITGPYSKVTARGVYPVVPIRHQVSTVANTTPIYEEVDLDLQHEINEVFDIMEIETWMDPAVYDATQAAGNCDLHVGLMDNVASVRDLVVGTTWETAPELVYYSVAQWKHHFGTDVGQNLVRSGVYHNRKYDEPYTVARNLLWNVQVSANSPFFVGYAMQMRGIIWGRKRRASETEFNSILYRERF